MRVFLDNNVLASALATRGLCADLFEAVLAEHDLLTCRVVLDELARILTARFRVPAELARSFGVLIEDAAELITETVQLSTPIPDLDDEPILTACRAGEADCLVTGDKALLELEAVDGMPVLSPRQFWEQYRLGR